MALNFPADSFKLPRRLEALAAWLPAGPVADIGCDHGLLAAYLAAERRVIAMDISDAALAKTRGLAERFGLSLLEIRKSDGFSALRAGEARSAVIAGLGGEAIARILREGESVARSLERLALQPMQGQAELRGWLHESGFAVTDERIVRDGRLFELLLVEPGAELTGLPADWPEGFYDIGHIPVLRGDKEAGALIERRLRIFRRQLLEAREKGESPLWLTRRVGAYEKVQAIYEKNAKA